MKIFSSFERTDVSHLADLFHRLEGSKEGGEEVGQDCEQVDDVHEASYELPPLVFEENLTKCNIILFLVECLKQKIYTFPMPSISFSAKFSAKPTSVVVIKPIRTRYEAD